MAKEHDMTKEHEDTQGPGAHAARSRVATNSDEPAPAISDPVVVSMARDDIKNLRGLFATLGEAVNKIAARFGL